ncbi:Glyoxalase/Bleomycin resistance protein/Dihydroxybiphenyl dioxygenase [Xylariomycetidae sp. FL0641]|nr:Glyoxalase/Bleomycin resistance protein/Dihydroxybiphenyl dioxygenase [Xylariomycetidae sp. FL0641]
MASTTSPTKVLSPAALAHAVLKTPNLDKMVDYYVAFLGARIAFRVPGAMAFLSYDSEHHRLALVASSGPQPSQQVPASTGLHHLSFSFETLQDLTTAYTQRKALGILPAWSVNHGPTTSIYYRDPDGNHLETQVDNMSADDANAYLESSKEFAENPIGVDFDPEELIKRLRSGESEEAIKKRPDIGKRGMDSVPIAP